MRNLRVIVFVDESNILGSARVLNRKLDWLALRDYLADINEGRELIEMVVYVGLPPKMPKWEDEVLKKERFLYWLRSQGFMVVTKTGAPGKDMDYKANVDVLMAIDAVDLSFAINPDVVVLVTGDADYAQLAYRLRRRGIRVEVASIRANLGNELKAAANGIITLDELFAQFDHLHEMHEYES